MFFFERLGIRYEPGINWTSDKRKLAGYEEYSPGYFSKSKSAFTFLHDWPKAIALLLAQCGYKHPAFLEGAPNYHFEVVATVGDLKSPFPWTLEQLDMVSLIMRYLQHGPSFSLNDSSKTK